MNAAGHSLYCGEDIVTASIADKRNIPALARQAMASGLWCDVVPGLDSLTVRFDPEDFDPIEAVKEFRAVLETPPALLDMGSQTRDHLKLPCQLDGPDIAMVSSLLHVSEKGFAEWFAKRQYLVAMMGFQPGFPYLRDRDDHDLPTISRLETPRTHVAAASIGFLGNMACIYAQHGPGGWPIIGHVEEPIINWDRSDNPFVCKVGQMISFAPQ